MDIGMVMKEASSGGTASPSARSTDSVHARRWEGVHRPYASADVDRLRGSLRVANTLAELGARRLWELMHSEDYVAALGALTGNQAVQMVRAGLKAIYLSGWQVAADANSAGQMYPDQSLYPVDSVPTVVKRINQALRRADQIEHSEGKGGRYWFASSPTPGRVRRTAQRLRADEALIEAGAAGVHFNQLASEECGHMGGKVLLPVAVHPHPGRRAPGRRRRDVPTLLMADRRRQCQARALRRRPRDQEFIVRASGPPGAPDCGGRVRHRPWLPAPYADLLW
jgi:isocitrate lyase